jgi:hypothetical protein
MKKVVRLTEADLVRIVKRVIKEQAPTDVYNPSTMGRVSDEPRMYKPKSNEFDWKSHFDQIKNELDSYLDTIEGPVNVKRFQSKVRNAYYEMVSNVDDEYSYPSHGDNFIQLTNEYMSYFRKKLKSLVQKYGKLTESDLARIVKRVIEEQDGEITPEIIIGMLMREAESTPQEDYDDPYDWMQDVFSPVEMELEEMGFDIDDLRMEYDDILLGMWNRDDDDDEFKTI